MVNFISPVLLGHYEKKVISYNFRCVEYELELTQRIVTYSGALEEPRKFFLLDFFQFPQEDHSFSSIAKNSGQLQD